MQLVRLRNAFVSPGVFGLGATSSALQTASLDSALRLSYAVTKDQTMKIHLLLGLLLSSLLCGCAANVPYAETMTDSSTQSQQRVLPDAPRQAPLTYQPGLDSGSGMMGGQ